MTKQESEAMVRISMLPRRIAGRHSRTGDRRNIAARSRNESGMTRGWPTRKLVALLVASSSVVALSPAWTQTSADNLQLARDIHKELVEINTVTATGDTLKAAEAMAARFKSAGFAETDVRVLSPGPTAVFTGRTNA